MTTSQSDHPESEDLTWTQDPNVRIEIQIEHRVADRMVAVPAPGLTRISHFRAEKMLELWSPQSGYLVHLSGDALTKDGRVQSRYQDSQTYRFVESVPEELRDLLHGPRALLDGLVASAQRERERALSQGLGPRCRECGRPLDPSDDLADRRPSHDQCDDCRAREFRLLME